MEGMKIGIIGDIHGCYHTLLSLYSQMRYLCDELYSVGDLIDRGNYSRKVIDFVIRKKIKPVMGNHEYMLLDAVQYPFSETIPGGESNFELWIANGGSHTMLNYVDSFESESLVNFQNALNESGHFRFLNSLPLTYEFENIIITHAGITKGGSEESLLWNRNIPDLLEKVQVFGHTPNKELIHYEDYYVNVDTGCVYDYSLTGVIMNADTGKLLNAFSVPADVRDTY